MITAIASGQVGVYLSLTEIISSLSLKPAVAANVPSSTFPSIGFKPVSPITNTHQNKKTASTKLKKGPATTIAILAHKGCRLNEKGKSSSLTSPSRSSTILT